MHGRGPRCMITGWLLGIFCQLYANYGIELEHHCGLEPLPSSWNPARSVLSKDLGGSAMLLGNHAGPACPATVTHSQPELCGLVPVQPACGPARPQLEHFPGVGPSGSAHSGLQGSSSFQAGGRWGGRKNGPGPFSPSSAGLRTDRAWALSVARAGDAAARLGPFRAGRAGRAWAPCCRRLMRAVRSMRGGPAGRRRHALSLRRRPRDRAGARLPGRGRPARPPQRGHTRQRHGPARAALCGSCRICGWACVSREPERRSESGPP
jgi:hypothetical protein